MHHLGRPHDPAAEHLADALQAEAHAQHGATTGEVRDDVVAEAGVVGRARPGGDQHAVGIEVDDLVAW